MNNFSCKDKSLGTAKDSKMDKSAREFFDDYANKYENKTASPVARFHCIKKRTSYISQQVKSMENSVLEIGCGTGRILKEIDSDLKIGIDLSLEMLKQAKIYCMDKAMLVQSNATNLPFADDSFDISYCILLLHHVAFYNYDDVESILKEMQRVTKNNGAILIIESNPLNPYWYIFMKRMGENNARLILKNSLDKSISEQLGSNIVESSYHGFVPDFCPTYLYSSMKRLEKLVEKIPFFNKFLCSHYCIIARNLKKYQ